jgi:phosphoglycerate dehydrogenase-like enzyme
VPAPTIAVGPRPASWVDDAIRAGGGTPVDDPGDAVGLVWCPPLEPEGLGRLLAAHPSIRWVQLPLAGIEDFTAAGVVDPARTWTCAKGSYAQPVAEHALALTLAGLRHLPERIAARSWGEPKGSSLYGQRVVILGGGGITTELLRLLAPMRVDATVVRRRPEPVDGAGRTVSPAELPDVLPGAAVVYLALALTPDTAGIIDEEQLRRMDRRAWLVNVARGSHVVTDALVKALQEGWIAGAALDVTDPEPLPRDHPLWSAPNCIVTPHTANTWEMVRPLLSERISTNVSRFAAGEPLVGLVDPAAGY